MSSIEVLKALFLGAVEGFTEFLPVSSTGHLLLIGHFIGFESKGKSFEILVQLGAILAILLVYSGKLISIARALPTSERARHFVKNVLVAFLPAMALGGLFGGLIKGVLFNPLIVCVMLVLGGLLLIVVDDLPLESRYHDVMDLPTMTALKIGAIQCLAMIPGVSRSGATIVGAMLMGASKRAAAEFSFFLAMPTMVGAFTLEAWKSRHEMTWNGTVLIAIGFAAAFVSGLIVVRFLLDYISRHGFAVFAWWRIIVGAAGLAGLLVFG